MLDENVFFKRLTEHVDKAKKHFHILEWAEFSASCELHILEFLIE